MDLKGKRALVTGAGRRLGRAFAEALLERGASVAIHFRGSEQGAREAAARAAGRAALVRADLADPEETERLVPRAAEALGGVPELLVNNASVFDAAGPLETDLGAWHRHLAVNLTAPFLLSREFARARGGRAGSIVNLLDWRSGRPEGTHFAYAVSKAGLDAMTRSMAQALAPSIRVNGLALGAILPPERGAPPMGDVPAGRTGSVAEAVDALLFLLAGPAYVTGEILHVDGGRHLT